MTIGLLGIGKSQIGVASVGQAGISVPISGSVFVYPAGRTGNYLFDGDASNSLGSDATNNSGSFPTDATRGTVWEGNGTTSYISGMIGNPSGDFWCSTLWINPDALANDRLWGNSVSSENDSIQVRSNGNIRITDDVGGTTVWTLGLAAATWQLVSTIMRQDGADVKVRFFRNKVESVSGEQTITGYTIPDYNLLAKADLSAEFDGRFSICNTWGSSILITPGNVGDIHDAEVLPQP